MNSPENNLIRLQIEKEITNLYKDFLEIIEDLKTDHSIMLNKIEEKDGKEYADNINYFNQQKFEQVRKRILDKANSNIRNSLSFIEFFDFIINKEKVEDAVKKKNTKKFVTNSIISIE